MIYSHGGWCNSVTNCRFMNANPEWPAVGRWFTVSAGWQVSENIYLGNNVSKNLMPRKEFHDQNMGEQVMMEGLRTVARRHPVKTSKGSFTFDKKVNAKKNLAWYHTAIVVGGKGQGQYRQLGGTQKTEDGNFRINVKHDWEVVPNKNSTILILFSINRLTVHENAMDGRSRAPNWDKHIASSGVQPWGDSIEVTVDDNRFHEIRSGISITGPTFKHLSQDNTLDTLRWGVGGGGSPGKKLAVKGPSTVGTVIRDNTFKNIVKKAIKWKVRGKGIDAKAFDMLTVQGNRITDTPVGMSITSGRYGKSATNLYGHTGLFKNVLRLGSAKKSGSVGIHLFTEKNIHRRNNVIEGFETSVKVEKK